MHEIAPISCPVDVELGQNDSCCVDANVDCIPCLRSVDNVDAVCSRVYEQHLAFLRCFLPENSSNGPLVWCIKM